MGFVGFATHPPRKPAKTRCLFSLEWTMTDQPDPQPPREPGCPDWKHGDPILRAWYWKERARLSERIIGEVLTGKQIGHGHHMADLEDKVKSLRRQVRIMQECAEHKNLQLRATNLFVGCTGGCTDASFENAGVIDEAFVKEAELTATRLRSWFTNWKGRKRSD